ncbi:transcriptional regulator [Bacillus pseudomycoides]|uniref:helix-turn-helix domain-containing protein n=1 Tax=Bacillus pseudomycoides TaxID=64104 RepID=UPI000BECECB7|nr:helix-turn-helix transcriptional regulator [Bacillus pseudomycoides]PEF73149.1 transcriptional regulator [Bacillus pseudomycoides]PEL79748.1 transcriptional regulator [Bacillus pseudomycoides]
MKIEQAFGIVLHRHRANLQLSQEEVAFQSGLDRTYISLLERGQRRPTINTLFSLARTLKVKPTQLIEEVEKCLNYQ